MNAGWKDYREAKNPEAPANGDVENKQIVGEVLGGIAQMFEKTSREDIGLGIDIPQAAAKV